MKSISNEINKYHLVGIFLELVGSFVSNYGNFDSGFPGPGTLRFATDHPRTIDDDDDDDDDDDNDDDDNDDDDENKQVMSVQEIQ
ncbi:hypothetical protein V1477_000570 [Vespula maculifrons]|uniref:Uncharacterized protein n=1 Tax=Vespula maculifrons TaxID=7453 RepID=A0ABD2D249_VESMC